MGECSREQGEAFITLATNDAYTLGCLVLGNSLRRVGTTRKLVVMITDGVSPSMRDQLGSVFDQVVLVNALDSSDTCNLSLLGRPDLSVTFTKLHCWRQTQYSKCVFLDADTLILQNVDDLFDRSELSAAPDAGWPDCFNSGVFVFQPSEETYIRLQQLAVSSGSFDGGDQGLLNLYFNTWATEDIGKHLPFTYNVVSQAFYSYLPAFVQFQDQIKIVHFIGAIKPWHHHYNMSSRTVTVLSESGHNEKFLQVWWDIFMDRVHRHLDTQLSIATIGGTSASTNQQDQTIPSPPPSHHHQQHDEHGMHHHHHDHHQSQHHQQHHHHHPHGLGHSDIQSRPTISYSIVYPYVPPNLDDDNDDDSNKTKENNDDNDNTSAITDDADHHNHHQHQQNHQHFQSQSIPQPSKVVQIPVVYRDYDTVETHYSEEPLTNLDPKFHPVMHQITSSNPLSPDSKPDTSFGDVIIEGRGGQDNNDIEKSRQGDGDAPKGENDGSTKMDEDVKGKKDEVNRENEDGLC